MPVYHDSQTLLTKGGALLVIRYVRVYIHAVYTLSFTLQITGYIVTNVTRNL